MKTWQNKDRSIKLINGDCLDVMDIMIKKNVEIDLVITSPPYNVDLGNNKFNKNPYNLYNDNKDHEEYLKWLKEIFNKTYQLLKDGGRVCINIGDGKNGAVPTSSDVIQFMSQDLNYIPMTHIIWNKNQVGNRTAWGSFNSPSSPSFPTPFEHILVFAKGNKKLQYKGKSDLNKEEFIEWSNALWTFKSETNQKKIGHPAMFPQELVKRCVKMFSWEEATILDPFNGAGTTTLTASQNNRKSIGIELDEKYFDISVNRIKDSMCSM